MSYLEIPSMLVKSMNDEALKQFHMRLKRTRKPRILFGFNGRMFYPTRRQALDIVVNELGARQS